MAPVISIIVPVYNVEQYLRRCIDSILAQTFSDIELILVDDGSFDNSGAICDEYTEVDQRVCVIHKQNGGASSARNVALNIAKGQYIMFCDSDDYVDREWCSQLYSAIIEYPTSWINCNIGKVDVQNRITYCYPPGERAQKPLRKTFYDIYHMSISGSPCNKIYSNEIVQAYNLRFDENLKVGEDVRFNVQYYRFCEGVLFIETPLYFYCQNRNSLTNTYTPNNFDLHRSIFWDRLPCIEPEYHDAYNDDWLYRFTVMLGQIFDARNSELFIQKMRYGQRMMQTEEFIYCATHAPGKSETPLFMRVIRTHNYYLFWLFQQLYRIKSVLRNR